ncbi:hypothetical protein [Dinghuibacter silviterrae]|uniref:Uncharacterized protein n=1 Tax=Dinghuibacter silviterrae TaxID=1539049 RepID=A0A4R8DMN3_9BACT|nr:hypothetical protein [Dinghuibacter silviterrae]TDW99261.1 hypothetical protein EDB95_0270 [Dinghuibacter silviterrae]
MKISPAPIFPLILLCACHFAKTDSPKANDTTLVARDTVSPHDTVPATADRPLPLGPHLTDTTFAGGSFILFLRPNEARFNFYDSASEKEDNGINEADSDFGVGISNTFDSLKANPKYKNIQGLVSMDRYILIKDCAGGPLLVDRDTVSYGIILSAKGKSIYTSYNSVHSGDYLQDIDSYFFHEER